MKKQLFVLLACLFVVMIGYGITLPVLAFYVERLALADGATSRSIVMHVTLLTGVYALMQLIFAPLWGRWSDRIGRRPLVLVGIAGYVVAQVMFGLSTSLWLLYGARIIGGILSSATLPASAAYVVDMTAKDQRSRGMAWLGTATSLGVVVGPALGGLLSRRDWHLTGNAWHFRVDSFSTPFFVAAFLGLLTFFAAVHWLPESLPATSTHRAPAARAPGEMPNAWRALLRTLAPLLALSFAAQLALALFEGTFSLFAQTRFSYGPAEVGYVFVVCGLVMTVLQAGAVGFLCGKVREMTQIRAGFAAMGLGIALLATAQTRILVFAFVAMLSSGMAFIAPNLSALVSGRASARQAGTSLGIQGSANSLAQSVGPLLGGVLFIWHPNAPYVAGGALLIALATALGWKSGNCARGPELAERTGEQ